MKRSWSGLALLAGVAFLAPAVYAADSAGAATGPAGQEATTTVSTEGPLSRWLTLDNLSFSLRYRNAYGTPGGRLFDSGQERSLASGKVKFDKEGRYGIGFRVSSGRYFNWGYSTFTGKNFIQEVFQPGNFPVPTGIAIGVAQAQGAYTSLPQPYGWQMYMRELYLTASPIKQVTFEFGGIGIERGVGSEITTFDEDGYMVGERMRIHDSKHLYFDELSTTWANHDGHDMGQPNFFARGEALSRNNYRQVVAIKRYSDRLAFSGEYDWLAGFHTVREAAKVGIAETRVLDSARVELYQRVNAAPVEGELFPAANGWSLTGGKSLDHKKWMLEGGYADIDRYYSVYSMNRIGVIAGFSLNGDSYQTGKRVFARASWTPHPYVTFFGFYTHEVDVPTDVFYNNFNKQNVQGGMTFNFKPMLKKVL